MNDLHSVTPPQSLSAILQSTQQLGFSMASEPLTGSLLRTLAATKPSGRLLEIGTGTGIATAWLLEGMDTTSTLISVDTDPSAQQVAKESLGYDARLTLVLQDGIEFLQQQAPESFDIVFADAMPGKYEGLELALSTLKPGGLYVIDDLLPQPNWPEGHAAKVPQLLQTLANDPRFELTSMAWASGLAIATRKSLQ